MALFAFNARAGELPALATYGRLPNIEQVEISPDGARLALAVTDGEQRLLLVRESAEGGKLLKVVKIGDTKLRYLQWAGPDHVLITVSQTSSVFGLSGGKREWFTTVDFNIKTGKQIALLKGQEDSLNAVLAAPVIRQIDGEPHAFIQGFHFVNSQGWVTLYRVNLTTGFTKMLEYGGDPDTDDWLVSADGQPLAQSQYEEKTGLWKLKIRDKGWSEVERAVLPLGSRGLPGLGRDGRSALAWVPRDDDGFDLREYAKDGAKTEVPGAGDFDKLVYAPSDGALLGGSQLVGDDLRYTFFDPKTQSIWRAVIKAFPNERVTLASWSDDRRKVVVMTDSPTLGPAYSLVDLDAKSGRWLTDVYRGLTAEGVSPVRAVTYKAADGLEIHGYLTIPLGREAKNLPLVVLPHGGPAVRDEPGFNWWSQALASRGYAVLQPNFRGSTGYGRSHFEKGFGQWGKAMQTDLSDGVRDLAKQGVIDPKRVCIIGASYGGYAALAGATIDRGVYRCAVSVAGPSDLRRMLLDNQQRFLSRDNSGLRWWLNFMGAEGIKDPDLTVISPALLADKVEIPILLIHGKDDTVVPYAQSMAMANALKKAGKPYELVTLPGEDHYLSSGATRLTMLSSMVTFLEKNNPPN